MKRETINIRSDSSDFRAAILSNLAPTSFKIGEQKFTSVESALQGIKFSDPVVQEEVFQLDGLEALKRGRSIKRNFDEVSFVHWDDKRIIYNSTAHRLLIAMFIAEKIRQNREVQRALLYTRGTFIYHDVGEENPNTSLPEKFYIEILLAQRKLLKKLDNL